MRAVITLTTDFGLTDPFVGIMKGVILNLLPTARIIDITHAIEPQNIRQAALVLESAHSYFPKNTVHLVVIDPGVGSDRRPIAVKTKSAVYVGPDNGVLTPVIDSASKVYELTKSDYFLKSPSFTFHGRDVFAPAVAWIAKGISVRKMGQKVSDPHILEFPQPRVHENTITGEIVYIDGFGNCISNISGEFLRTLKTTPLTLHIGKQRIHGVTSHYSQLKPKEFGCLMNSWDRLEIFCRDDNAQIKLKCRVGTTIKIK